MSEKKEAAAAEGEAAPKSKKKLIIIIAVAVLLLGGGGAFFLMGGSSEEEHVEEEHEEVKRIETADLGNFIVNLSETSSFLKTHVVIEYDAALVEKQTMGEEGGKGGGGGHGGGASGGGEAKEGGLPEHFKKRENAIKDAIIRVLSAKKAEDMLTAEGKDRLKDELLEAINEAVGLEEPTVSGIFFTEFIIQ